MQRSIDAKVTVNHEVVGSFTGPGLVLLIGITHTDTNKHADRLAEKIHGLRIFDQQFLSQFDQVCVAPGSARELSVGELGLPILVISQFTLYASTAKGRRPTWDAAAPGDVAEPLVETFVQKLRTCQRRSHDFDRRHGLGEASHAQRSHLQDHDFLICRDYIAFVEYVQCFVGGC